MLQQMKLTSLELSGQQMVMVLKKRPMKMTMEIQSTHETNSTVTM
jgi:hypothetical protein